ncbi:MAG: hypothetical protein AAFX93_17495 [Verrucomicrobiota bacterium]
MDIEPFIGPSKSLSQWLGDCKENRGQGYWLIFKDLSEQENLSLETEIFPITGNTGELTDDEFIELDDRIVRSGFSNFLNLDQLEDIVDNLNIQKADYNDSELLRAVEHYFSHDAFISIDSD